MKMFRFVTTDLDRSGQWRGSSKLHHWGRRILAIPDLWICWCQELSRQNWNCSPRDPATRNWNTQASPKGLWYRVLVFDPMSSLKLMISQNPWIPEDLTRSPRISQDPRGSHKIPEDLTRSPRTSQDPWQSPRMHIDLECFSDPFSRGY